MFGFAVGFYDYYTQLKVLALVPALFFLAFNYFPESPAFLQLKQKEKHAEKSLSFFQGVKHVPKLEILEQELKAINVEEKPVDEKAELEKQQQKEEVIDEEDESLSLRDFCKFENELNFHGVKQNALNLISLLQWSQQPKKQCSSVS